MTLAAFSANNVNTEISSNSFGVFLENFRLQNFILKSTDLYGLQWKEDTGPDTCILQKRKKDIIKAFKMVTRVL